MEETSLKDPLAYSFLKPADDLHLIFHARIEIFYSIQVKLIQFTFDFFPFSQELVDW